MKTKIFIAVAGLAFVLDVTAQTYPAKPIRLMVPFPPGGSTDIVARIVAQKLSSQLGQGVVIENRGGAGGTLGTAVVAKAPADGYMLTVGTTSTHVVAPSVFQKLEYDPVKDFAPISLMAVTPYLLVVNPSVQAKSLKELVELMKSQPGKMNYASAGVGSRSPSGRRSARPRCPTCPAWPSPAFPGSTPRSGSGSWRRPARRSR